MKRTIKKYHLKANIIDIIQQIILYIIISIIGALAIIGLIAIYNARVDAIENNQNTIENK